MASILGLRGTGNWGTDERPKNFRESILFNNPNGTAILLALSAKMGDEPTNDPEFSWWEELLDLTKVQVNNGGGYSSSATTIVVDSGALNLVAGDILQVAKADAATYDNEILKVSQDPTTDTSIVVSRGYAGSTAASIADDTQLVKIGSAYAEGTGAPTATTRNPTKLYNYTQIFKTKYSITGTAAQTNLRTGNPVEVDKKRKMSDHSIMIENAILMGRRSETVGANGLPERTMAGILSFISTNRTIFSGQGSGAGQWGIDNLLAALSAPFNFTSPAGNERMLLMGNTALLTLNKLLIGQGTVQYEAGQKIYGMDFTRIILPQGTYYVKSHPLMSRHPQLTKAAFVLNPSSIKWRPMKGRDTKMMDNIQDNDADSREGQWITEASIEVNHEETMAYMGNLGG